MAILSMLVVGFALQAEQTLPAPQPLATVSPSSTTIELAQNPLATSPLVRPNAGTPLTPPPQADMDGTWHTGVIKDIVSSDKRDHSVGRIWEDNTHRTYQFMATMSFKRWEHVKFMLNQYGEVANIARINDPKASPVVQTVTPHGQSSVRVPDSSMRIIEGTTLEVRQDRSGKTMGIVRTYEGRFVKYRFESSDYYRNNQRVRIKLDLNNRVVSIEPITASESRL